MHENQAVCSCNSENVLGSFNSLFPWGQFFLCRQLVHLPADPGNAFLFRSELLFRSEGLLSVSSAGVSVAVSPLGQKSQVLWKLGFSRMTRNHFQDWLAQELECERLLGDHLCLLKAHFC